MDLGERCLGQATAKRSVQPFRPGRNECSLALSRTAMAQHGCILRTAGRREGLGQPALDLRDFAAQGKNSLTRHGGGRHVDLLPVICSCYVLMDSRAATRSQADSRRIYSCMGA